MNAQPQYNPQSLSCPAPSFPEALQDTCCQVFLQCLHVFSPRIVSLINTVYGKNHALTSKVVFPDRSQLDKSAFPNHLVSVPFRILEKQGNTRSAADYCLEFCPQFSEDLTPEVMGNALAQG